MIYNKKRTLITNLNVIMKRRENQNVLFQILYTRHGKCGKNRIYTKNWESGYWV